MFFPPIAELATTDIVSVSSEVSVSEALRQMAARNVRNIVVRHGKGRYGLLTAPDVVKLRFAEKGLDVAVGSVDCAELPVIPQDHNILDMFDQLDGSQGYAAVVDGSGALYGIVSNSDILGSLDPQLMLQRQCLGDLLKRHEIKTVRGATPLAEVLVQLVQADDAVIVIAQDAEVGILTTQDAIRILQSDVPLSDPVEAHMSTPLHTVSHDLTVSEAIATLHEKHFKRLVVRDSDSGRIIGLITQKDLIGVAYSRWADLMRHHALELQEVIDILERKAARLERMATTDALTGIANRARFEELLQLEQQHGMHAVAQPFSIILFDIDRFKQINDTWGHGQGDVVLKTIARQVQGLLRGDDTVARWGGEEFAVLLPRTGLEASCVVADKICEALGRVPLERVGTVTASFGVATIQPGESGAALLARADGALYEAKRRGRNQVVPARVSTQREAGPEEVATGPFSL